MSSHLKIFLSVVALFTTSMAVNAELVNGVDFFEETPVEVAATVAEPVQETVAESAAIVEDTIEVDDFEYVQAVHRRTANYDYRSVEVDGHKTLLETAPNSALEIGVNAGVDYFNSLLSTFTRRKFG